MFTNHGTFIIGYSSAKQHFSITPEATGMKQFSTQIKPGWIQFNCKLTPYIMDTRSRL